MTLCLVFLLSVIPVSLRKTHYFSLVLTVLEGKYCMYI